MLLDKLKPKLLFSPLTLKTLFFQKINLENERMAHIYQIPLLCIVLRKRYQSKSLTIILEAILFLSRITQSNVIFLIDKHFTNMIINSNPFRSHLVLEMILKSFYFAYFSDLLLIIISDP